MKRPGRIIVWLLILAAAVAIALAGGLSASFSRLATREVNRYLATLPDMKASCADIRVSLLTGSVNLSGVEMIYDANANTNAKAQRHGMRIAVDRIEVEHVFYTIRQGKSLTVNEVSVTRPEVELWIDEDHPQACLPPFMRDSAHKPLTMPFKKVVLKKAMVEGASFRLHSIRTPLDVAVNNCSLTMQQLKYNTAFSFNDSLYAFSLAKASVCMPDGRTRISTSNIALHARGILSIGPSRYVNTTEQTIADNQPGADVCIDRMELGPLSHERLFQGQAIVQALKLYNPTIELWMDDRQPDLSFPDFPFPFSRAELKHLVLRNASLAYHCTYSPLDIAVDSCSLAFHHLAYKPGHASCDTTYDLSIAHASVLFPDGQMHLDTRNINCHEDGIFSVGETRLQHYADEAKQYGTPGVDIRVGRFDIGPLSYAQLVERKVVFEAARLIRPSAEFWLDEDCPEACFPMQEEDARKKEKKEKLKAKVAEYKAKAKEADLPPITFTLSTMQVDNASVGLHSVTTQLDVVADSCCVELHDLHYDDAVTFNDTAYSVSLAHAALTLPDGTMKMSTRKLSHSNQGKVHIGPTRITHNMERFHLGDSLQQPCTWMDMQLAQVTLSAINPIRIVKDFLPSPSCDPSAKGKANIKAAPIALDSIKAVVAFMDIFRDERYKPVGIYRMPQALLMELPVRFHVRHTDAEIRHMHIDFASTKTNIGKLDLRNIRAGVEHITNIPGFTMSCTGTCPVDQGTASASLNFTMSSDSRFAIKIRAKDINTSFLNGFIRPLVGMTSDCRIDSIRTAYTGNDRDAQGTFQMVYHDFSMKVHKQDSIPYQIITKHADSFTRIGNALVPKSNPLTKHAKPKGFHTAWTRNPEKPVELYLCGPLLDGVKKTFLPGLYVRLRTKEGEIE